MCLVAGFLFASGEQSAGSRIGAMVIAAAAFFLARKAGSRFSERIADAYDIAARLAGSKKVDGDVENTGNSHADAWPLIANLRAAEARMAALSKAKEQSERDLGASTSLLQTAYAALTDAVLVVDTAGRLVLMNPAAEPILGLRQDQIGRPLIESLRAPKLIDLYRAACRSRKVETGSGELAASDNGRSSRHTKSIAIVASPLPSPPGGAVVFVRDETELRRLERMRSDFVSNVSHELKTPVTSIQGYADTLRDGALEQPELAHRFLNRIIEQSERLGGLIVDMLDLSRLESPEIEMETRALDACKLIESIVSDHEHVARNAGLEIGFDVPEGTIVSGDEQSFHVLLGNLLKNAIEHTPSGGKVGVTIDQQVPKPPQPSVSDASELVAIHVSDTGEGIAREHQARIFERFFRVDKSRNRQLGGSGLGLAIVKHTSERLGGYVTVESVKGQGSTFHVAVPGSFGNSRSASSES